MGDDEADYTIVIIGDSNVGKTCFCNMYFMKQFNGNYNHSLMKSIIKSQFQLENEPREVNIIDTCDNDNIQEILLSAHYAIIMFDFSQRVTFDNLGKYLLTARGRKILIVGNKDDLGHQVTDDEIQNILNQYPTVSFMKCDTHNEEQVSKVFNKVFQDLVTKDESSESSNKAVNAKERGDTKKGQNSDGEEKDADEVKKSSCCNLI